MIPDDVEMLIKLQQEPLPVLAFCPQALYHDPFWNNLPSYLRTQQYPISSFYIQIPFTYKLNWYLKYHSMALLTALPSVSIDYILSPEGAHGTLLNIKHSVFGPGLFASELLTGSGF
jgi:hypothetical protein